MSRLEAAQTVTQFLGIELFTDSQIVRVAVIPARYSAVGTAAYRIADRDVEFPLADLDRPGVPNATIMVVGVRRHPGEAIVGAFQFRYHHRDAMCGAQDLTRRYGFDKKPNLDPLIADSDLDALIAGFLELLERDRVGGPIIVDLSHLDVMVAVDAIGKMPFGIDGKMPFVADGTHSRRDSDTCERYQEKELARLVVAKGLMIPYTVDLSKEPEADLLRLDSATCQVVLACDADGEVTFDPFDAVGDYSFFVAADGSNAFRFLGCRSNREAETNPFWRVGRVSLGELQKSSELIGVTPHRVP